MRRALHGLNHVRTGYLIAHPPNAADVDTAVDQNAIKGVVRSFTAPMVVFGMPRGPDVVL
tara:strand:+ start:477 stop:656 length:180 start_codon:yes stop_codon:yes gene_type:complete